jgi:uncharacterized repeat protein (TIGR03803 family)
MIRRTTIILALALALVSSALAAGKQKVLHTFTGHADGRWPTASLIFDNAGNLYSTTSSGGTNGTGAVFKLNRFGNGWKETVLYSFSADHNVDGYLPKAPPIFDEFGHVYGTTAQGGPNGGGIVFKLVPHGHPIETILHSFGSGGDGAGPYAPVIFDRAGSLYGTTAGGGVFNGGTVFKLTPTKRGWKGKTLYSFGGYNGDGHSPYAGLIMDKSGNLFGTTQFGGKYGCGTGDGCGVVFKLTRSKAGWTETILHTFCSESNCSDGGFPVAPLIFDKAGNLYGTTQEGGAPLFCTTTYEGCGTVFELKPNPDGSWTENVLYTFVGGSDGGVPMGGVVFDRAGNLYGTTSVGGGSTQCTPGCGTLFELTPSARGGWTETLLYSFCSETNCTDGDAPYAGVILDQVGNLYGTTFEGGTAGAGVVFEFTP